jgi:(1->4)-alpha-D-glucan 1-alpha-D-glucosylmutase
MRLPGSTYRIQCRAGVGIRDVIESLDYLQALGITDLYLSPIALARAGSTHGYDVCDPNALDPDLGTAADLDTLKEALQSKGMGLILDIVPNHLAADESRNQWWRDVLGEGSASTYAPYFDIDWRPPTASLAGKVLLPILDRPYGEALERAEIVLEKQGQQYVARYGDRRFPIAGGALAEAALTRPSVAVVHAVLERQHYRLAHWRTADEVNYRRFFNIEHLVGVRVEDREVFDATHNWLCRLLKSGLVTGVRVDHPDGLAAPADYLWRLQRLAGRSTPTPLYVVVEKVLVGDESLPADWPVQGTTGYEFLNAVNNLFVSRQNLRRLERGYARFVGRQTSFERTEYDAKKQVIATTFASTCERLVAILRRIGERDSHDRDLGSLVLRRAVVELTASLPVYRTYAGRRGCSTADLVVLARALRTIVRRQSPGIDSRALAFIVRIVTRPTASKDAMDFVTRWQQFSSAVFAKAVEDRAFYRDNTLLSLNEVGSDRAHPGGDVAAFHAANAARVSLGLHGLLATTTHDTKLSEDVRSRLHVLTECSRSWLAHVDEWRRINNRHRTRSRQGMAPDRDDEYRFYQLLIGLWPAGAITPPDSIGARLTAAMIKGAREAARRTSWTTPNEAYEGAVTRFVELALAGNAFVSSVSAFSRLIAKAGMINSLAQTTLKIGSPGVPDFYQGTELCSLRLADPDNRQPVDTAYRHRMLSDIRAVLAGGVPRPDLVRELLARWEDGGLKLFVTTEALAARRREQELFTRGDYLPLHVIRPPETPEIVAFARRRGVRAALVAVPCFVARASAGDQWPIGRDVWQDASIELPESLAQCAFTNHLTGEVIGPVDGRVLARDLLRHVPVAFATSTTRERGPFGPGA